MASEYNYDESGETWPFFILAILSLFLIPLTIKYISRILSNENPTLYNESIKGSINLKIDLANKDAIEKFQNKQKSSKIFNKTLILLIIGWSILIYIGKYVTKEADLTGLFDPYTILDISFTASEKEIKSKYRKLSLKYHPDKLPRDLTEEARQQMEQEYIRVTSAYKALTDEAIRENFLKYGHPDGEQSTVHGIALPKFLVDGKYNYLVVLLYFVVIGLLLPYLVGKWWSNVKSHTRNGLHVNSASNFVRAVIDRDPAKIITPKTILDWILESEEINQQFKHLSKEERLNLVDLHFNRKFDKEREDDKIELISKLPFLINGLIDIAVAFKLQDVVLPAEDVKKCVISATPINGKYHEILQLPFVDPKVVESQDVKKLGKLFAITEEQAKAALGIKNEKEFKIAMQVASKIPSLRILEAEFKVPGEEDGIVPPNSTAHISLKFLVKSPRLKSCPDIDDEKLKDEENLEYMKNPLYINEKQPSLPYSYAPYFPHPFKLNWSCYLINQKENKIVEDSTKILLENIDLSNLEISQEEWIDEKNENLVISTFKIPFTQPTGQIGKYHYRLIMKNNAYFGSDLDIPIDLKVTAIPLKNLDNLKKKLEDIGKEKESDDEEDSDSDISDPEEDSLAGALAALKGQAVKKKSKKVEEIDEDEEEEEPFSDINTDTEDEGDN
ncbi:unnamed protein product [Candida verbasci]|uniref:J domain-containing protein n=1 Tax=Candida verbasci TaxID=1227364 RepID=A0A9W4TRW6_9ASCO|nr:unnamed protein product [Candida verbasci]